MSGRAPISAVVFDFDGVIADTEPLHYAAFCEIAGRDGMDCSWDDYVRDYIGYDDRDLFRTAYRKLGRELSDEKLRELVRAKAAAFIEQTGEGVRAYEGIPELVHYAAARYPLGLCSGALRSDIDPILAQLGLLDAFTVVVTAEDVRDSKPDPACYRLTVERMGAQAGRTLDPETCLAIEDTPGGIHSAKGAGLRVWAVTHTHTSDAVTHADRVFESLSELQRALGENEGNV